MENQETILVLDCGSRFTQLIARQIREMGVYSVILPWDSPVERIEALEPKGVIISGGAESLLNAVVPCIPEKILNCGIPLLGIGSGSAVLNYQLGGSIRREGETEYRKTGIRISDFDGIFNGLPENFAVWMNELDTVEFAAPECHVTALASDGKVAAICCADGRIQGVFFHPEVVHTEYGRKILENFVMKTCRCRGDWELERWVVRQIEEIKKKVGNGRVVAGLSGGVDSTVSAVLTARAVDRQLDCIFVDHGFLRKGEVDQVLETYKLLDLQVHFVDAAEKFSRALDGVSDPERKRKIIGELFIRVFEEEASKLGGADWLLQGTIYPDVIESGTSASQTIKSHHNVGGLPEDMRFQLLEPVRDLFKGEVIEIGRILGVPQNFLERHPFPGPGLAVRCLGELVKERLDTLREADAIFIDEIRRAGLYTQIWQAFCVLIPTRSVGVSGKGRTYGETVVLRAVNSEDAMTADWVRLPWDLVDKISRRICKEVPGVGRVVLDVSGKPPATIEWE